MIKLFQWYGFCFFLSWGIFSLTNTADTIELENIKENLKFENK